ncbi:MAG: VacJ family lipoprotein [Rhodospirillaceae bacterium]|nr:VacJ family lipoprotein [Rhodospirillaceae bacterium]MBT6830077.1 VacJ family lipoprotein [Rhodospirillaceae bacterium]
MLPALRSRLGASLFLLLTIVLVTAFALPSVVSAALPAGLTAEFERIAGNNQDVAGAGAATGDDLASLTARAARRGGERAMAAAVIGAIAEMPLLAEEIVEAAIRAAPHLEAGIVSDATAAFPGFLAAIQAAQARARMAPPVETKTIQAQQSSPVAEQALKPKTAISTDRLGPEEISDPLEGINRAIFFVNGGLDTILVRPIAWVYGNYVPPFAKQRVSNFFTNLNAPVVFANDLLQFEFEDAAETSARFLINSTIGLAGLFDVASEIGLEPHEADFGQTLHTYGVGPGPYLVLPLLGPSNLRDGFGRAVDTLLNPLTWLLEPEENLIIAGAKGLVQREELLESLDAVRETSVDYYAALRSLYYQNRAVELGRGVDPEQDILGTEFDDFE